MGILGVMRSTKKYTPAIIKANGQLTNIKLSKREAIVPANVPSQVFFARGERLCLPNLFPNNAPAVSPMQRDENIASVVK